MVSLLKLIVPFLSVVTATRASQYLCTSSGGECSYKGLTMPPPGYWPAAYSLNLDGNDMSVTYKNSFSGYPNLEYLSIRRNQLTEVDFEDFAVMKELSVLSLGANKIRTLNPPPENVTMNKLRALYVQENAIARLDPDVLAFAPNLLSFDTTFNPIVVTEGERVLNHPMLSSLAITYGAEHGGHLDLGPESFAGLPRLNRLSLTGAGVSSIAGAFATNGLLEALALSANNITEVPAGSLPATGTLKALYLNGNPLQRVATAAVNKAVAPGAVLYIGDSPLACGCKYEALFWWAQAKGVTLDARCQGQDAPPCEFARRRRAIDPPAPTPRRTRSPH